MKHTPSMKLKPGDSAGKADAEAADEKLLFCAKCMSVLRRVEKDLEPVFFPLGILYGAARLWEDDDPVVDEGRLWSTNPACGGATVLDNFGPEAPSSIKLWASSSVLNFLYLVPGNPLTCSWHSALKKSFFVSIDSPESVTNPCGVKSMTIDEIDDYQTHHVL